MNVASAGRRIARAVVRHRFLVISAWVVVVAAIAPFAGAADRVLEVAARVRGSQAEDVARVLREQFRSPFATNATLATTGVPAPNTSDGRDALRQIVASIDTVQGVSATLSYLNVADSLFLARDARDGSFVVAGLSPRTGAADAVVPALRAATDRVAASLRHRFPGAVLRWTGEIAINFDLRRTSAEDLTLAERRVLPLTLTALILAFGTIVAALLPVVAGVLAISVTLGVAVLLARHWPLSILLQNTVSMMGLGVGIDYALLTVSRFREAAARGQPAHAAAEDAAVHAGGTIAVSGLTVMIGFVALIVIPLNELRAIGVGGLLVVAVSVLMATTLLPALLAVLAQRVEWGRLWRRRPDAERGARWSAWGRFVARHPVPMLAAAGIPLLLLAGQGLRIVPDIPRGNWLPANMESARGLADLDRMGHAGVVNTIRLLLVLPGGMRATDSTALAGESRLATTLLREPLTARVQALVLLAPSPGGRLTPALLDFVPPPVRRTLVSDDGRTVLLEVVPRDTDFTAVTAFARRLRQLDAPAATGLAGATIRVGGLPAFNADYVDAIHRYSRLVVLLVIATTLLVLVVVFRSVLVPLKAVLLNLLSVGAAFGAVVLVFQDGHAIRMMGLTAPMAGVFPAVPIVVFCVVFGLSMDYEIFLVARVAEARRAGLAEDDALAEALGRTAGVITSAASIMIVVFAAFTLGHFLLTKILGFALATAVFLDATLVRLVVGPALLKLAGRWNWWPGR